MPREPDDADRRTLERSALAEWSEAANAHVVSVTIVGRRAEVALLVNGDYEYWAYFQRDEHGWYDSGSANGPTLGWDGPNIIPDP